LRRDSPTEVPAPRRLPQLPHGDPARFPIWQPRKEAAWSRMHRRHHGAWWFSSDGSGRFDLAPPNGTCYLAETALGALVEHFDGISVIPQEDLDQRRISVVSAGRPLRLADCTSPEARRFGADLSLSASSDYARAQRFAAWFRGAGLEGVRYLLRNDPAATMVGIALFGPAGEQDLAVLSTSPVDDATLATAAQRYGIEVVPTP
jgi:RES domain